MISDELRNKIYTHLDINGINGRYSSGMNITLKIDEGKNIFPISNNQYYNFVPDLSKFDINDDVAIDVILDYIFDTTGLKIYNLNDLEKHKQINNKPFILKLFNIQTNQVIYSLASKILQGSLTINNEDNIESLGNIEVINGDLGFINSQIKDLGNLMEVKGSFWISQTNEFFTKLDSLQKIEYIGGDLTIKNSSITDLGNLKYVGGNLNIRQTFINNLGKCELIKGNLLLSADMKSQFDFRNTKIAGKIKYFNDRDLSNLFT